MESTEALPKVIEAVKDTTKELVEKLELIPLYEVRAVINGWGCFCVGLEKVLDYTIGETSIATIYNDLLDKRILMWVGYLDGKYVGFCTTRLDNLDNKGIIGGVNKYISVVHLYIKKGTDPFCFFMALKQMKGIAKKIGCNMIRMWTIREDWGNALHGRGWKKGYQEYYLEVK